MTVVEEEFEKVVDEFLTPSLDCTNKPRPILVPNVIRSKLNTLTVLPLKTNE